MKFSRSRQLRYRWYDSLLCFAPLLMVYNLTPWLLWVLRLHYCGPFHVHGDPPTSFYDRPGSIFGKCFRSGNETNVGTKVGARWSNVVVLRWLSGVGTSQEVFSLIWRHSTAPLTSPACITLRWPLWRSPPPPRKTLKWNSPDHDNWDIVVVTRCCALPWVLQLH